MSKLRFRISTSLDGFVAGPNQSHAEPLGVGGEARAAEHGWGHQLYFRNGRDRECARTARRAAQGKDVALAGGARTAQQFLNAGAVDKMQLHVVPMLLGGGERLFESVHDLRGLALVQTVAAPNVTHLKLLRA